MATKRERERDDDDVLKVTRFCCARLLCEGRSLGDSHNTRKAPEASPLFSSSPPLLFLLSPRIDFAQ